MNLSNVSEMDKNRFPIISVLFCVLGVIVAVSKIICTWGIITVFPGLFSYVMNGYLYISVMVFAIKGYKDMNYYEKKPYKGMLFKFCMMLLISIISLRMGNIWYIALSGVALLLAIVIYRDIPNYDRNKKIILAIWFLTLAAAIVYVVDPLGSTSSLVEKLGSNVNILDLIGVYIPENNLEKYVFIFDSFSQFLQWTCLGGIYLFNFKRFVSPEGIIEDMLDKQ